MFLARFLALAVVAAAAAPAGMADDDDWYRGDRDRDRDRGQWGRRDDRGWGQERYGGGDAYVVDRTISDLRRVASRSRVDGHERTHFERALYHLDRFRYSLARERRFERSRLDDAIEHIDDLSRADQLHPRDRDVLRRDLQALRAFRSGRW